MADNENNNLLSVLFSLHKDGILKNTFTFSQLPLRKPAEYFLWYLVKTGLTT